MKRFWGVVAVALVVFFAVTQPGPAADAVQTILGGLRDAAEALITFVRNVFNG